MTTRHWQVTAHMRDPIAISNGDGLHLDGPLAFAAWQEARARSHQHDPIPEITPEFAHDFDLPLEKWEFGDSWGWCCSAAIPVSPRYMADHVRRMPPIEEYVRWTQSSGCNIGAGPSKAINKQVQLMFARVIVWTFAGDGPEVLHLLRTHVMNIGKIRSHGHGSVLNWSVSELDGEWSPMIDGQLIRRMPAGYDSRQAEHRGAMRAPYWHRTRLADAVGPDIGCMYAGSV